MQRMFLKLDGIKGESQSARHAGEIEIKNFYWGRRRSPAMTGTGRASIKDLTVIKQADRTSTDLKVAWTTARNFEGLLTVEDYSVRGSLVRSIAYRLQSVFVDSVTGQKGEEVIALNCKSIKLLHP
jgi:type VI protein secretion system component Hcp